MNRWKLSGHQTYAVVKITGYHGTAQVQKISLITADGKEIYNGDPKSTKIRGPNVYAAGPLIVNDETFYVRIEGIDDAGLAKLLRNIERKFF